VWIVVKISVFFTELHSGRCEEMRGVVEIGEKEYSALIGLMFLLEIMSFFFVAFVLGLASVRGMAIGLLPTIPVPDLGL